MSKSLAQPSGALWRQVAVDAPEALSSAIQDVLLLAEPLGLVVQDDDSLTIPEKPVVKTGRVQISATFEIGDVDEDAITKYLRDVQKNAAESISIVWSNLQHEDWEDRFKSEWVSFEITPGIWIVPSWEIEKFQKAKSSDLVIQMDPGMAFGTGHHETTSLCADAVMQAMRKHPHAEVLDVGTGTGVLAIIALKLGAKRAVGTEIDPIALDVARENAAINQVSTHFATSLLSPSHLGAQFDFVIANILSQPLIDMAQEIVTAVRFGGQLVLSGILREQARGVIDAYTKAGMAFERQENRNDWVSLHFWRA